MPPGEVTKPGNDSLLCESSYGSSPACVRTKRQYENTGINRRVAKTVASSPPSPSPRPARDRHLCTGNNKIKASLFDSAAAAQAAESCSMRAHVSPPTRANPQLTADVIAGRKRNSVFTKQVYTEKRIYVRFTNLQNILERVK